MMRLQCRNENTIILYHGRLHAWIMTVPECLVSEETPGVKQTETISKKVQSDFQ